MDLHKARGHIRRDCPNTTITTVRLTNKQLERLAPVVEHSGEDRSSVVCIAVERFLAEYENAFPDVFSVIQKKTKK
jgi:predicted DNA-binding protein